MLEWSESNCSNRYVGLRVGVRLFVCACVCVYVCLFVHARVCVCLFGLCACLNVCSQRGGQCISCSYKANHGMLFPLEKGFIFVHKPALHVRFDEVVAVNFSRGGTGTHRSFDFELEVKNNIVHIFQSMDK